MHRIPEKAQWSAKNTRLDGELIFNFDTEFILEEIYQICLQDRGKQNWRMRTRIARLSSAARETQRHTH